MRAALPHLGVIVAEGPDAATFLHGQLSQDIKNQPKSEGRLAAYCTAKGRMLASFLVLRPAPETLWLVVDQGVLPAVLKRLSMFVLRAKVKLSDGSATLQVQGHLQRDASANLAQGAALPVSDTDGRLSCQLPPVQGVARTLVVTPPGEAAPDTAPGALAAWRWLEVLSGVPQIESGTVEQFVPQMINYELIGGVNFKKGCYPGQEVVARSQYRGTTKRRAFVLLAEAGATPGAELFSSADPGQPAGMVINAAAAPHQASPLAVLAELKLEAAAALEQGRASLHLGDAQGPALAWTAQPYPVAQGENEAA
ncbi:MAG: hypothetical protein RI907_2872 [Pseudomonadota bacterium]|jgi:folate-binding protein YgfZ